MNFVLLIFVSPEKQKKEAYIFYLRFIYFEIPFVIIV